MYEMSNFLQNITIASSDYKLNDGMNESWFLVFGNKKNENIFLTVKSV